MTVIAMIGAGSIVFAEELLADILAFPALKDIEIRLMDIDPARLDTAYAMALSVNKTRQANAVISKTDNRKTAIEGADFIINTIGVGGFEATKTDLLVPHEFGIRQTIGDTLGIGGIFRSLRSIPIVLEICKEIEELAPDALLLNYANPMATHCLAIQRATKVNSVGLCHGVHWTRGRMIFLAKLANMPSEERAEYLDNYEPTETGCAKGFASFYHECADDLSYDTLCAGINHMAAYLKFEKDGIDQYPEIDKACALPELRQIEMVRLDLYERFGYFLTETSGHISEYLPWYLHDEKEIDRVKLRVNSYIKTCEALEDTFHAYQTKAKAGEDFIDAERPIGAEHCPKIINAMVTNQPHNCNGNVNNDGGRLIGNLPADCCVEVPMIVDSNGLQPQPVGDLPPQIAAMIRTNVNVQDLVVNALLEENREYVYHAAYFDPNTAASIPLPRIKELVDTMIEKHGDLMPGFLR